MKILAIEEDTSGNANTIDVWPGACIRKLEGHEVTFLDPSRIYEERGERGLQGLLQDAIKTNRIEVIFYSLGDQFHFYPRILLEAARSSFLVMFIYDDENYFDISSRYYAQAADLVLTTNPVTERYAMYGIEALYAGGFGPSEFFYRSQEVGKTFDTSFVGSLSNRVNRAAYIDTLERRGFEIRTFGYGTANGPVSRDAIGEIFRRSRINLNFTGIHEHLKCDEDLTINRLIRSPHGRCQQIALCGSFVLSEYAPGIERIFEIGKEIDVFQDADEMIDKVQYYLKHEEVRERMALRAYERSVREYESDAFWSSILRDIERRLGQRRRRELPVLLDGPFLAAYGAFHVEQLIFFLFAGKWRYAVEEGLIVLRNWRLNLRLAIWHVRLGLARASKISSFAAALRNLLRKIRNVFRTPLR